MRNPTEQEYRWQCYTLLSYGCTAILLWDITGNDSENFPSVLNTSTMAPNKPLYDDCAAVMWEMRNLSDVYVKYKNLGAFTVNCTDETPYLKMSGEYKSFDALTDINTSEPHLIGCFDAENGNGHAFTVVNMTDLKEMKNSVFSFKTDENAPVVLYRNARSQELTADGDGYYTIELEWGEGVFVTIG